MIYPGIEWQKNSLLKNLSESNFVVVVGNSGVGKTSFIHSQILPELKSGFISNGNKNWKAVQFRPGRDPLVALANAMVSLNKSNIKKGEKVEPNLAFEFETILRKSKFGIIDIVEKYGLSENANIVFFIDQLGDVVVQHSHDFNSTIQSDFKLFVSRLVEVINQSAYPIKIVSTLRTDRIGLFATFPSLAELINKNQFLLSTVERKDIRSVFRNISDGREFSFEPDFLKRIDEFYRTNPLVLAKFQHAMRRCVDQLNQQKVANLIAEVEMRFSRYPHLIEILSTSQTLKSLLRQNDNLPHLNQHSTCGQFVLDLDAAEHFYDFDKEYAIMRQEFQSLMRQIEPKSLDLSYLEKIGGLDQSIHDQLEQIFKVFSEQQKETCRLVFQSMTGMVDAKAISIPRTVHEISNLTNRQHEDIIEVVKYFSDKSCGAIRVFSSDDTDGKLLQLATVLDRSENKVSMHSEISITQDTLLEAWPRLQQWINDERDNANIYIDILKDVATKQPLYEGEKLKTLWHWYETSKPNAGWAKRYRSHYEVGFELAEEFLLNSKRLYDRGVIILQDEERSRSAKAERYKKIFIIGLVTTITLGLLGFFSGKRAITQTNIAAEAMAKAIEETRKAVIEKANADSAIIQANKASREALRFKAISKQEQEEAKDAKEEAGIQLSRAKKSLAEQKVAEERARVLNNDLVKSQRSIEASNLESEYLKTLARVNKLTESGDQLLDTHLEEEKKIAANLASIAYQTLTELSKNQKFDSSNFHPDEYRKLKAKYIISEKKLIADMANVCQSLESPVKNQLSKVRYGTVIDQHPNTKINRFVVGTDQNKIWRIDLSGPDKGSSIKVNVTEDVKVPGSLMSGIRSIRYSASGKYLYTGTVEGLVRANNDSSRINKKRENIIAIFAVKVDEIITIDRAGLIEYYQNNGIISTVNAGNQITAVAYSARRNQIVMNGANGELLEFDIKTNDKKIEFSRRILNLGILKSPVTALQVIDSKNWLALGTRDGDIIFYDDINNKMIYEDNNEHFAAVNCLAWDEEKQLLVSGGMDNLINVWQLKEISSQLDLARKDYKPIVFKELQPIQDIHFTNSNWFLTVSRGNGDENIDRNASGRVSIWSIDIGLLGKRLGELKGSWSIPDFDSKYYKYIPD